MGKAKILCKASKKPPLPLKNWTWRDLAAKIEWEGGLEAFFINYLGNTETFTDPILESLVTSYRLEHATLKEYLRKRGGLRQY